ncbi:ribonuclease H-like domain-containing protein [Lophiotrema nucula]|uniref:ribonuclease H n=1 Tax=Lophiotrema nucula TaxID=690887 RepID=A0A6A5Z2J4_9PLEO|nr:ribonuclease H-like domain-containing protein [Lophiotrema nucula]
MFGRPLNRKLDIYTDGSSFNNGKDDAIAGLGVWFGHGDHRNAAQPLGPGKQTNQRAELKAVKIALERAPNENVIIHSDSKYTIDCVTYLWMNWEVESWYKSAGILMENTDLIRPIVEIMENRKCRFLTTGFTWVKGHSGNKGNEAADALAREGSK